MLGFLFLIFAPLALGASGESYINLFGGRAAHNQDSMADSSTRPTGLTYGIGLGKRVQFYEFELNVSKGKLVSDIEHDGESNTLVHDQTQFNLSLNFYLVKEFYIRLGYALTSVEQTTEKEVTGASGVGLEKEYGLEETKDTGLVVGGGWIFAPWGRMNFYLQYEYFMLNELKASQHLGSAGLRFYY